MKTNRILNCVISLVLFFFFSSCSSLESAKDKSDLGEKTDLLEVYDNCKGSFEEWYDDLDMNESVSSDEFLLLITKDINDHKVIFTSERNHSNSDTVGDFMDFCVYNDSKKSIYKMMELILGELGESDELIDRIIKDYEDASYDDNWSYNEELSKIKIEWKHSYENEKEKLKITIRLIDY